VLGSPLRPVVKALSAPTYGAIRGVTSLVGEGLDRALEALGSSLGAHTPSAEYALARAALNGVVGDHLAETHNALAVEMEFLVDGRVVSPEAVSRLTDARGRVVVLVHGSSMDALGWTRHGHDHGAALARDLDATAVYARYNSGLHVSTNGAAMASALDALLAAWPVPVTELTVLGFSMGGLVARSAVRAAEEAALPWRSALRAMVFLGTPHHGAPLERVGNVLGKLLDVSRYSAPLARLPRLRSAGITDLRYGNVLDADWSDGDRFAQGGDGRAPCPLPRGVRCFALAGSTSTEPTALPATPGLRGDGLVPVASALGLHPDPARDLGIPSEFQRVVGGVTHLDLLDRAEVCAQLRAWLAPGAVAG
jgi:hypothetical protein